MKRLLYVEDNSVTRKLVKRQLDGAAEIAIATSLSEARALLREQVFDLVLADVNLPDGNSLDLVSELRTRYSATDLPVILVSVSMDQLLKVRAVRAGANECLPMPMPWAAFVGTVKQMLLAPYVRPVDPGVVVATWVEGRLDNRHWVYCPELNLRLDGESLEAIRETMLQRLRSSVAAGVTLPFVSRVKLTERLVEIAPR